MMTLTKTARIYLTIIGLAYMLFVSCANPKGLTGGDKDSIGPKAIMTLPKNKQLNYHGRLVYLEFDEWIKPNQLQQQLIITPQTKGTYDVKYSKNYIRLIFDEDFEDSTTYTLNFRKGIVDVNEGNGSIDNKIVFSTGNYIDSLQVSGEILAVESGKGAKNSTVGLYLYSDGLDISKQKPMYMTRTESDGSFAFENLKSGQYLIYAFTDKKNIGKYMEDKDRVAFYQPAIDLTKNIDSLTLYEYKQDTKPPRFKYKKQISTTQMVLTFSENLQNIKIQTELDYWIDSKKTNTVNLFNTQNIQDSLQLIYTAKDSSLNVLQDTIQLKFVKKKTKSKASIHFLPKTGHWMDHPIKIKAKGNKPIHSILVDSLMYKADEDTLPSLYPKQDIKIIGDSLIFSKAIDWKKNIEIDLSKSKFITIDQDTLQGKTLQYIKRVKEEYGELQITIKTTKANYIIEVLDKDHKVIHTAYNTQKIVLDFLEAGEYSIRAIVDTNNNQKWDQGNHLKRQYPEMIHVFDKKINLRKNWVVKETFTF